METQLLGDPRSGECRCAGCAVEPVLPLEVELLGIDLVGGFHHSHDLRFIVHEILRVDVACHAEVIEQNLFIPIAGFFYAKRILYGYWQLDDTVKLTRHVDLVLLQSVVQAVIA